MYTKEQIISEIRRVAEKLGVESLKQKDFEKHSMIPMTTIRFYLGSWGQAVKEAGVESPGAVKSHDASEEELLLDLIRVYKETGETPTLALVQNKSKYSNKLYTSKWKSLNDAFLAARKKYPHKFGTPAVTIPGKEEEDSDIGEYSDHEKTDEISREKVLGEEHIDFSNLIMDRLDTAETGSEEEEEEAEDDHLGDTDPNEITSVQNFKTTIAEKKTREEPKKEPKKKPVKETAEENKGGMVFDDEVDFSDLGLDQTAIVGTKPSRDKAPEMDSRTIRVEPGKKVTPAQENNLKTVDVARPKPVPAQKKAGPFPKPMEPEKASPGPAKLYIPETIKPKKKKQKQEEEGEALDFRGLRYAPMNQQGVLFLFGMISQELGFVIESLRSGFPMAEGKRCLDKESERWEKVRVDFEFRSSYFNEKGHNEDDCDLIVCWTHDWLDCPLEVLELRAIIGFLDSAPLI